MTQQGGRTALYRFYDVGGHLLYVGITKQPEERFKAHSDWSRWFPLAARHTMDWFERRSEAEAAEVAAIKAEKPVHNKAHNFERIMTAPDWPSLADRGQRKTVELAALVCAEVESGRWPSDLKTPPASLLASAAGVCLGVAERALESAFRDGYLYRRRGFGYFVQSRD